MRTAAKQTRENRTITVDFHNEMTYDHLLGDGKAFLELDPRAHLRRNLRFRPPENSWRLYETDFDFLDEFFGRFLTPNSLLSAP
jgi:hypothetical protein